MKASVPVKPMLWAALLTFLTACTFIPGLSGKHPTASQIAIEQAGGLKHSRGADSFRIAANPPPEILTFPLAVPLHALAPATSLAKGKSYDIALISLQPSKGNLGHDEILMPVNGSFKILFQPGGGFKVLDQDARDGLATVQLPNGPFQAFVGGAPSSSQTLTVQDLFYYQQQILGQGALAPVLPGKGQMPDLQWYQLGIKPLPVPGNWYGPEGQSYALHFTNNGLSQARISWVASASPPVMPLGMKEIGPAGGTIELPNVAKLEIPAGALSQPTVVRVSQALQAASKEILCFHPNFPKKCFFGYQFVSPIVKIEPLFQELNISAKLSVLMNHSKYDGILPPEFLEIFGMGDLLIPESISFKAFIDENTGYYFTSLDGFAKIKLFAYYGKFVVWDWKPRTTSFHLLQENSPSQQS